jgi:hypothetical protein
MKTFERGLETGRKRASARLTKRRADVENLLKTAPEHPPSRQVNRFKIRQQAKKDKAAVRKVAKGRKAS